MNVDVCPFPNGTLVEMWYLKFSKCFLLLCFFIYIYIYIVQWCRAHSFYWDIYFHLYLHVEKKLFPNFFLLVNLEFLSKDKIILCSMLWYHKNSTGHIFFFFSFLFDWSLQKRKSSSSVQMMVRISICQISPPVKFTLRNRTSHIYLS